MKLRRTLLVIFYVLCIAALGACVYTSYLSYTNKISVRLGFLLFMPLWIMSYWFSTFFYQAARKKNKDASKSFAINKKLLKVLNGFANLCSFALLGYWIYMYIKQYLSYKN